MSISKKPLIVLQYRLALSIFPPVASPIKVPVASPINPLVESPIVQPVASPIVYHLTLVVIGLVNTCVFTSPFDRLTDYLSLKAQAVHLNHPFQSHRPSVHHLSRKLKEPSHHEVLRYHRFGYCQCLRHSCRPWHCGGSKTPRAPSDHQQQHQDRARGWKQLLLPTCDLHLCPRLWREWEHGEYPFQPTQNRFANRGRVEAPVQLSRMHLRTTMAQVRCGFRVLVALTPPP